MATDAELLDLWGRGDRAAGSELFERHYSALLRFFTNKLASQAEVEDLVQATLFACIDARARFRGDASFKTFLFSIARNVLLKFLRDERRLTSLDAEQVSLADCGRGQSSALGAKREQQLLLAALRHIPLDSQVMLEMVYWEQMTAKQVAEILGETQPAIRGRLSKAKRELRAAVERLATTPQESSSTLDGLERWARSLRGYWEPS